MPDAAGERPQERYPYLWFTVAGGLALAAIVSATLMFADPYPYAQAVSVVCASLCAVAVAATLMSLRMDKHRRSAGKQMDKHELKLDEVAEVQLSLLAALRTVAADLKELRGYVEERAARVEMVAQYATEVWGQSTRAHSEHLFDQAMKRVDQLTDAMQSRNGRTLQRSRRRRKAPRPEDVDTFLDAIDAGDNVIPLPDPRRVKGDEAS